MKNKKIILARHGEGTNGSKKLVQSRFDLLTLKGIQQANELAQFLKQEKIDHIIASPSFRTLQTATIVAGTHNLSISTMEELIEINFGSMQGKPAESLTIENAMELGKGENPEQVFERVKRGWNKITNGDWEGTMLIVSHRSILSAIEAIQNEGTIEDFLKNRKENDELSFGYWKTITL